MTRSDSSKMGTTTAPKDRITRIRALIGVGVSALNEAELLVRHEVDHDGPVGELSDLRDGLIDLGTTANLIADAVYPHTWKAAEAK